MKGKRRKGRELALEALYRFEIVKEEPEKILKDIFSRQGIPLQVKEFVRELVLKTISKIKELDNTISTIAENWELNRIAIIDKNILRAAICEIVYFPDIPPKVSVNEAIEIAKKYSTENSGKFINGILDKVIKGNKFLKVQNT
ncbi:transcription antitermination factor NusB [candidate division WOR-3 bacterium]|nr:transcription antitermination factor NusB [candidate division WOR-3 bacterium]